MFLVSIIHYYLYDILLELFNLQCLMKTQSRLSVLGDFSKVVEIMLIL